VIQKKKQPEDVSVGFGGRMNRTGIGTSPIESKKMVEGAVQEATPGDPNVVVVARRFYIEDPEPIGTMPPPATLKGAAKTLKEALSGNKATVFIDKLAERLAFERTGTRLYDALIGKFDVTGPGFDEGPTREDLLRFRREEYQHFLLLKECLEAVGADPTAMTPSADIVAVEGMGLANVIGDARTTFPQSLHAILVAELADKTGWELLIQLARELGQDALAQRFVAADAEEAHHLITVRRWVASHASWAAKVV
jgi:hypothetical protein